MGINTVALEEKGWSDDEVEHAEKVARKAEEERHPWLDRLEGNLHWLYLAGAVVANVTLPFAMLPVLVGAAGTDVLPVIAACGVAFGGIATAVYHQLDRVDAKHHALYVSFIFLTGLFGFGFVISWANSLVAEAGVGYQQSSAVAFVYLAAFLIPYGVWRWLR